jgi:hypothetical protein
VKLRISGAGVGGVAATLGALFWLFVMDQNLHASIWWSGPRERRLVPIDPDFDIDADGAADFLFSNNEGTLSFIPLAQNAGVATSEAGYDRFRPLPSGAPIGEILAAPYLWMDKEDYLVSYMMHDPTGDVIGIGPWRGVQYGLLGVSFEINSQTHYGWIRMSDVSPVTFVLHDWAYETRPGVPIKAGAKPVLVPVAAPEVARPGYLRLRWSSEVGKSYQVQAKTHLDALRWTDLGFVIPATSTETMVDLPMEGAAQFFRVIEAD